MLERNCSILYTIKEEKRGKGKKNTNRTKLASAKIVIGIFQNPKLKVRFVGVVIGTSLFVPTASVMEHTHVKIVMKNLML